jgi:SAM-dependent methyltransferase
MSTPITYRDLLIDRYRLIYDWVPRDSGRLLDIGCGNGIFTRWLVDRARLVTGCDHNPDLVEQARRECPGIEAVQSCGESLPFESGRFDVVVMSDVLEHMDDDTVAVREALRVLCPNGLLLISLPNRGPLAVLDGDNLVNGLVRMLGCLRIPRGRNADGSRRHLFQGFTYRKHRHYGIDDLKRLLGPSCEVERVYYGGILLWPLAYLVEKFCEVFFKRPLVQTDYRLLRRLRALDFRLNIGRWSYNLVVAARKRPVPPQV